MAFISLDFSEIQIPLFAPLEGAMDFSHRGGAHLEAPMMSLSVGGLADDERLVGLHKGGAPVGKGLWGMVQNSWFQGSSNSSRLKRKRVNGDTFSTFNHDVTAGSILGLGSPSPSESEFSTGIRTSSGTMFLRAVEDECFPTDLGLGLTGPNMQGLADGCFTSLVSGGRSVLASVDSDFCLLDDLNQSQGTGLLGSKSLEHGFAGNKENCTANKDMNVGIVDPRINDLGMQLQLGLSRSSTITADADYNLCAPFNLGQGGTYQDARNENVSFGNIPVVDEGSTSARSTKAGGYIPSLLMGRRPEYLLPTIELESEGQQSGGQNECMLQDCNTELGVDFVNKESASQSDLFMNFRTSIGTTSTSVPSAGWERSTKTCKFKGCGKGARGASGLCIIHGGGRRCQRQGCNKGAEGSTVYCKSHGGGRRCQNLGCTKSAEGKTDYCIAHGGGRRCSHDGCSKAARGRSGLCIRHGGGKRCQKDGCTKSAEGYSGLCISHGGGRRCQFEGCNKGAQGSTMFCKAHGGGKRCMIQGCNKGAEGSTPLCKGHGGGKRCMFDGGGICTKSVHGGTSFCVAHGGGKRCAVQGCTKSARGRTDFCVRHGGGKRCKIENCTKSAQGSTDFCKAHGGGKRCSWGQEGSPYSEFVKDKTGDLFKGPCERFARGKLGLCAAHCALVQDRRVHGAGTIGNTLSSGIGPGLFRGIVEGSIHDGASRLSIRASTEHGDLGSECGRSDSLMQAGGSSSKPVGMECELGHAHELPQHPPGHNPGLTFSGSSLNFLDKERLPSDKVDEGSVLLSNYGTPSLWPDLSMPGQSNSNHAMNLGSGDSFADAVGVDALTTQATGPDLAFLCRPVLPPQVLVPMSMRKGDSFQQEENAQFRSGSYHGMFNTSSLCLPEQRVHGGNVMALLSGMKPSSGASAYR